MKNDLGERIYNISVAAARMMVWFIMLPLGLLQGYLSGFYSALVVAAGFGIVAVAIWIAGYIAAALIDRFSQS